MANIPIIQLCHSSKELAMLHVSKVIANRSITSLNPREKIAQVSDVESNPIIIPSLLSHYCNGFVPDQNVPGWKISLPSWGPLCAKVMRGNIPERWFLLLVDGERNKTLQIWAPFPLPVSSSRLCLISLFSILDSANFQHRDTF